jgi:hypothetical protein
MDDCDNESLRSLQVMSEQLQKLLDNARRVRSEFQGFKDGLSRKLLCLRPSVGGISAISCCEQTPQLGFTNISVRKLGKIMEEQLPVPGRPTPEKHLQSWLIRNALESGGRLKALDDVLGGQYWFVSDEIGIDAAAKKKVVADLLLVRVDAEGLASLVNAELKSNRAMETFRQIICFRAALEHPDLQERWKNFAEVMTGETFRWHPSQDTRGIVIWPVVKKPMNALANKKRKDYARVDVIGYRVVPKPNDYALDLEEDR